MCPNLNKKVRKAQAAKHAVESFNLSMHDARDSQDQMTKGRPNHKNRDSTDHRKSSSLYQQTKKSLTPDHSTSD